MPAKDKRRRKRRQRGTSGHKEVWLLGRSDGRKIGQEESPVTVQFQERFAQSHGGVFMPKSPCLVIYREQPVGGGLNRDVGVDPIAQQLELSSNHAWHSRGAQQPTFMATSAARRCCGRIYTLPSQGLSFSGT